MGTKAEQKIDVEGPATYGGVAVNHPSIVSGIKTLAKQGHGKAHIMKVIGMPGEVVDKYMHEAKREEEASAKA